MTAATTAALAFAALLGAATPSPAAEPAPAPPAAMDRWIVALRCRERPTIEARMACYGLAARLAAEGTDGADGAEA